MVWGIRHRRSAIDEVRASSSGTASNTSERMENSKDKVTETDPDDAQFRLPYSHYEVPEYTDYELAHSMHTRLRERDLIDLEYVQQSTRIFGPYQSYQKSSLRHRIEKLHRHQQSASPLWINPMLTKMPDAVDIHLRFEDLLYITTLSPALRAIANSYLSQANAAMSTTNSSHDRTHTFLSSHSSVSNNVPVTTSNRNRTPVSGGVQNRNGSTSDNLPPSASQLGRKKVGSAFRFSFLRGSKGGMKTPKNPAEGEIYSPDPLCDHRFRHAPAVVGQSLLLYGLIRRTVDVLLISRKSFAIVVQPSDLDVVGEIGATQCSDRLCQLTYALFLNNVIRADGNLSGRVIPVMNLTDIEFVTG